MIDLPYLGTVYIQNLYVLILIPILSIIYFLIIRKRFVKIEYKGNIIFQRIMLWLSRTLIVIFLIIAIASPFNLIEKVTEGDPRITILFDNSTSMEIFDLSFVEEMRNNLNQEIPTSIRYIGTGNNTRISEGIFTNLDSGNLILITDGQNYQGRDLSSTLMLARSENTTIWAVNLKPIYDEFSLTIEGPSKVVEDVENEYIIKINKPIGKSVKVILEINGEIEFEKTTFDNEISFNKRFYEGQHRMIARLDVNDKIKENNIFYKSIEVIEKPKIFFLTEKLSPMLNLLEKLYNVDVGNRLPNNLDQYLTIIINDIHINRLNNDINRLTEYANKGNGVIFIGGENSFEHGDYRRSSLEKLLPVNIEQAQEKTSTDVNIVLLIDKSGSTMHELRDDMPGVNVAKGMAIDLIRNMDQNNFVGAIAFNHRSEIISPMVSHFRFNELIENILDIFPTGMTDMRPAFNDAIKMLENRRGSKNIIIISDGEDHIYLHTYIDMFREAVEKDIVVHTTNFGLEKYDVNMKVLADWGRGNFFNPDQGETINVIFEKPIDYWPLRTTARQHFINNNLNLNSHVTGFNLVNPKSYAQVLVSTEFNDPILISGRYGLGRILVFATDDGNYWASTILRNDPKLISRMVNWGIENPQRNKDEYVDISDSRVGEKVTAYVKSKTIPEYQNNIFSRIDENLYRTEFYVNEEGFYEFMNKQFAINYHQELEKIGMNDEYLSTIEAMGWELIEINEIDKIKESTLNLSKYTIKEKNDLSHVFIIIAIILLLIELIIRRINRFKKIHK